MKRQHNPPMRLSTSALSILSCLGVILSTAVAVYSLAGYLALSNSAKAIEILAPGEDMIAPKIETLLAEHENKSLILGELKARYEQNASLHATLTKMAAESKGRAMNETILWAGAGAFFFVLLVFAENLRRREKAR